MSARSKLELTRKAGDASLRLSRTRSEVVASSMSDDPGSQSIDELMTALRKSIAERAQMSDKERQAEVWEMQKLAARGDIAAQKSLGHKYYFGQDVPQDYAEAAKWYKKAAEQGDYGAQYEIGEMYCAGEGLPQDYSEALYWLRKSAAQGYDEACWSLAEFRDQHRLQPRDASAIKGASSKQ
jgi:TPR repeat protein